MKKIILSLCLLVTVSSVSAASGSSQNTPSPVSSTTFNGAEFNAGKLVVRVHPAFRTLCTPESVQEARFQAAFEKIGGISVRKKFRSAQDPGAALNRYGKSKTDLSLVYEIVFTSEIEMSTVINTMMSSGILVYAEPLYKHRMSFNPNDPSFGSQQFLTRIKADSAWNIEQGDTNVVIGIIDSGTDWDHPDLQSNIAYNWNDPINGVDDDADGFVDNFRGWDVSENDNNPMVVNSDHGSHVSGCAAAVTNNSVGVASPGFNCRFLPVKSCLDASVSSIDNGYDGVYYAAEHGCDIINCSWGRGGGPSQFEQDVMNFAVFDHDAVVVAAAGNSGTESDQYPPAYNNVLSVASTGNNSDTKSGFSTYAYSVDVCAPGSNIYTTVYNNSYVAYSGTSMAAPVAAGGVGLIRSRFPSMNALQAAQQLRVTCDNIYNLTGNTAFRDKLGKGRINLNRAVRDSVTPGVIVESLITSDRNDNVFVAGDTLNFTAVLRNLLRPTTNLNCTLSTTSTSVTLIPATFNAGVLATNDTISNYAVPFRAVINAGTPLNTEVAFKITTYDGTYSDFYAFKVVVNVDYINIEVNDVGTSITSKGLIGYNESGQVQGIGFTYQGGPTILYEMGLMVGASGTQVSDNVRGAGGSYDSDFSSVVTVSGQRPGTVSSYDAYGRFTDNSSAAPLPVLITHRAYAWDSPAADRKYIIVEYVIKNTGTSTLNGLYGGIFADWDIPLYSNNFASEDLARRMGYCWSTDAGGLYAGIKLLTQDPFNHYAIDNSTGGNGGADLSDGFDNSEKYFVLSNSRSDAGNTAPTGNDVIDVVSTGPFNLAANDSVKIAFALIAGESLTMIQDAADASQIRYDNSFPTAILPIDLGASTSLQAVYPNPASTSSNIEFTLERNAPVTIGIYNMTGELVSGLLNQQVSAGRHTLHADLSTIPAGNYLVRFVSGDVQQVRPLNVVR